MRTVKTLIRLMLDGIYWLCIDCTDDDYCPTPGLLVVPCAILVGPFVGLAMAISWMWDWSHTKESKRRK